MIDVIRRTFKGMLIISIPISLIFICMWLIDHYPKQLGISGLVCFALYIFYATGAGIEEAKIQEVKDKLL